MNIVNPSIPYVCKEEFNPQNEYDFPLDNFQKYAIEAIHKNENVLITAKTGSGKTLIGEYQIKHSLSKNKRVFYTTPIKSLSNQKYHDLKKIYGRERVGIITGDIKFQPQAEILIMTTEILRNLLYKENSSTNKFGLSSGVDLNDLDAVIFDEVHYINDTERGKVWEETLILLNKDINLVLLSATIGNPEDLGKWLVNIKQKPLHLISTTYRIIPLTHYVLTENNDFVEIMNSSNEYNDKNYCSWISHKKQLLKEYDEFKRRVKNREEGQVITEDKTRIMSPQYKINKCIEKLKNEELLPALFFIFSRKDCEKYAGFVEGSLIDSSDSSAVNHIINFHLHYYEERLKHLEQYHKLRSLLLRGIAYHHSGLLPILKEIIEILFNKGYIKVLFATETFAVGINMPTKTVVFLDYKKYDENKQDLRLIRNDEYLQMAGRAGRRGIDTKGIVIYLPIRNITSLEENKSVLKGKLIEIESRMDFHYDFLLKLLHSKKFTYQEIVKSSYFEQQISEYVNDLEKRVLCNENKQKELNLEPYLKDLEYKKSLEDMPKTKETQRLLNAWQNKHMGPTWNNAIKKYTEWLNIQKEICSINEELERIKNNKAETIETNLRYLEQIGFIDCDKNLTLKGILATEINEVNSLLFIECYTLGMFKDLSIRDFIALIAMFQNDSKLENENTKSLQLYEKVGNIRNELKNKELIMSNDKYWEITDSYIEPMIKWIMGDIAESICKYYNIFPGNLYRLILSVSNTLEEFNTVCEINNDVEMLEMIKDMKNLIIRDIAVSESLYLRL